MKTILLLDNRSERIQEFRAAVASLGEEYQLCVWSDAGRMIVECTDYLSTAALISLDHDLVKKRKTERDPGDGLQVAKYLAGHLPICPVIIHTTNPERSWSMHNELQFSGWRVERFDTLGEEWINKVWLPKARELLATNPAVNLPPKAPDHDVRMSRTLCSLEGLAIGDALGELFFYRYHEAASLIQHGYLPPAPWLHTDDTEMAIAIVEVLKVFGAINQEALARRFAWHFEQDPDRGYGSMTRDQMLQIREGKNWRTVATAAFGGQGSMGNGGAMRAAPLGAYFAEDLPRLVTEAEASATVTHTHAEGIAGTIAVAVAAAAAWTLKDAPPKERPAKFFETVLAHTPHSRVRSGLEQAAQTPWNKDVRPVVHALGNGSLVTAPDTVPFAVWCAAHNLGKFSRALMTAISGGGDCDTNAAIAGGIVAVTTGRDAIPDLWRESREPLPFPELA